MTERDIEIFLTIIEKKNLSKAASALFMSPSSLAYHLGQLEKELNVTLFSRRKVSPSPEKADLFSLRKSAYISDIACFILFKLLTVPETRPAPPDIRQGQAPARYNLYSFRHRF